MGNIFGPNGRGGGLGAVPADPSSAHPLDHMDVA